MSTLTGSLGLTGGSAGPEATVVGDGTGWVRWPWPPCPQVCSLAPQGELGNLRETAGNE